jgi:hypothetical protein
MPAASSGGGATGGGKGEGGARVARGPPVSPAGGDAGRVRCYNYSPHQCFGKYLRSIMVMPAYVCHTLRQYRRSYTSESEVNFQNVRGIYTVAQHDADAPI